MRVNLISFHMRQHAKSSGYSRMTEYLKNHNVVALKAGFATRAFSFLVKRPFLRASGLEWYCRERLADELAVMRRMLFRRGEIYHFIYGENSYRYAGKKMTRGGNKMICTFHLPPGVFNSAVRYTDHIRDLDAIIAVADNQVDFFSQFISREKIFLVPHGVDADYFSPGEGGRASGECLFVGHYLRDFKVLRDVIRIVSSKNSQIKFTAVVWPSDVGHFDGLENVTVRTSISDEELRECYRRATMLIQPMLDCTANNSILEGMSSGCPVIATEIGGIGGYVDNSFAVLEAPGDAESMAKAALRLCEDKEAARVMALAARRRALEFSWSNIAGKIMEVYSKVMEIDRTENMGPAEGILR